MQQQPYTIPNLKDDHERWYTEIASNNRMRLCLLSGIDTEISWALRRLLGLCINDDYRLRTIPGLIDALYEWPEWFSAVGYKEHTDLQSLFAPPDSLLQRRQHAILSACVLRNAALTDEQNANTIAIFKRTLPLVLNALHNLDSSLDANSEFISYIIDIFQCAAPTLVLPPKFSPLTSSPLQPLLHIASTASNKTMIISSLRALTSLFSNPQNTPHLSADSPALSACIKYLPLHGDKDLLEACLTYLYAHLSHPTMSKAFLRHSDMARVLRILVTLLLVEQEQVTVTYDINVPGTNHTVPSTIVTAKDHELSKAELDSLLETPEPKRCFDWMSLMFVAKPDGVVTQVDFWNLYKAAFEPFATSHPPLLVASEVIKNVNYVFHEHAHATVLPGPPQRFVVQGVARRKDTVLAEKLKCQWFHGACTAPPFSTAAELCEHVLQHVESRTPGEEAACEWSTCFRKHVPTNQFRGHVLTHFWSAHLAERDPSQSDTITLSHPAEHPDPNPTQRNPPLPRSTVINFQRRTNEAPSTSLLALLCIRILFQMSFASKEVAPKVDADHFGFPGVTEEIEDDDEPMEGGALEDEKEGERKGCEAFGAVRKLLEAVQFQDETLMSWIIEMINA